LETKFVQKFKHAITLLIAVALFCVFASGCIHGRRTQTSSSQNGAPSGQQTQEMYGPSSDMSGGTKTESYGPAPIVTRSVVLLLGPGQARAFAEEGVIRALTDANISIAAVYGVEVGALVGSVYAMEGSANQLEWGLMRFKESEFGVEENVFSKLLNHRPNDADLEKALKKTFEDKDLSETKIPMKIVVQPEGMHARLYEKGPIAKILRAALASSFLDGFEPVELDGVQAQSAAETKPFPIDDAKAFAASSGSVVIAVDVLESKNSDLFPELKAADFVIRPDVQAIGPKDYGKRNDAFFAGKSATLDKMDDIKKLVNPS
jgi:predicted acylesterase/phospholipase RssA